MELQEHFISMADDVYKQIDDMVANDENYKGLDKGTACETFFDKWLESFEIRNPDSEFFLDPDNDDDILVCNVQNKLEFLTTTLEIFGLPTNYIDGGGHHADWETKKALAAQKKNKGKGKKAAPNKKGGAL